MKRRSRVLQLEYDLKREQAECRRRLELLQRVHGELDAENRRLKAQLDVAMEENSGNMVLINRAFAEKDRMEGERDSWRRVAEELKKYASYTSFDNMAQYTDTMERFRKLKEETK